MNALGVIKEADAARPVSLNGDSLALKASAKHRRREGSDQAYTRVYRFWYTRMHRVSA